MPQILDSGQYQLKNKSDPFLRVLAAGETFGKSQCKHIYVGFCINALDKT